MPFKHGSSPVGIQKMKCRSRTGGWGRPEGGRIGIGTGIGAGMGSALALAGTGFLFFFLFFFYYSFFLLLQPRVFHAVTRSSSSHASCRPPCLHTVHTSPLSSHFACMRALVFKKERKKERNKNVRHYP